jgi:hypothetical protein
LGDPRANGQGPKSDRADAKKKFKWDAIRFSHKVYAIFAAAKRTDADVLIWIDADTFCHSHMPRNFLNNFIPEDTDIGYLGREGKYSECGFYSMNLKSPAVQEFLRKVSSRCGTILRQEYSHYLSGTTVLYLMLYAKVCH